MFEIKTKTLLLRDFRLSDIEAYRDLRSDEKFQRFYDEADSSEQKAEELVRVFIEQAAERPRLKYQLAITDGAGKLAGTCGIRSEGAAEFSMGCELGRSFQGSGIAREAGKAMIDFGFRELGANRIYAETVSENKAAIRLCRQLGMSIETERQGDRFFKGRAWGTTIVSIYKDAWSG